MEKNRDEKYLNLIITGACIVAIVGFIVLVVISAINAISTIMWSETDLYGNLVVLSILLIAIGNLFIIPYTLLRIQKDSKEKKRRKVD